MQTLLNLNDLLQHEIQDLYSAEQQIIDALPEMIEKANNTELKKGLREHLEVTKKQKSRLDEIKKIMGIETKESGNESFLSSLFSSSSGSEGEEHCRGMEGLIKEGKKMLNGDMSPEVMDAAIIACAQKIEHYEIAGYGTSRAYASELNMAEVERLLSQTLFEEYDADDLLTSLAVGKLNEEAIEDGDAASDSKGRSTKAASGSKATPKKASTSKKAGVKKTATVKKAAAKKAAPAKKTAPARKAAPQKKAAAKKAPAKKAVPKKAVPTSKKAAASKKSGNKKTAPKKAGPVNKKATARRK
jgi:ferritin-like metal-binding protein YciE